MSVATLVVELLTEELPPRALARLGEAFAAGIADGLRERGFLEPDSAATPYATPRRLAVSVSRVRAVSPDQPFTQKLMPAAIALDPAGRATPALRKKLEGMGRGHLAASLPEAAGGSDRLVVASDGKAQALFLHSVAPGSALATGLQAALEGTIAGLPIPKVMTYQVADGSDVRFVRPAHRLLALHGPEIVPVAALGLQADRRTAGHRFLGRREIVVATAEAWHEALAAGGKVIAGFAERREHIVAALGRAARGASVIMPEALLDEVTALVEWPAVFEGRFDEAYLEVPQECLILSMQQHQKYFALADAAGRLLPRFLLVSNLETADPSAIVQGNERVLRARLADARFFFDQDRKRPLASRVPALGSVVYHNRLGSQLERVERVVRLAGTLAGPLGADPAEVELAARLSKADLLTDMVGEFPELQGTMGRHYATHEGLPDAVARALEEHYWPRFAGDGLPTGAVGRAVALADRADTLVAIYGLGLGPTGEKDPFALRRHALAVLRLLMEARIALPLEELLERAAAQFASGTLSVTAAPDVYAFMIERLRHFLRERGYTAHQVDAVLATWPQRIDLVPARVEAVREFSGLPEAQALAGANKRILNILRKAELDSVPQVDPARLTEPAERTLHDAVERVRPRVQERVRALDYTGALKALSELKAPVDTFFDRVLVNADDPQVRANRLGLLAGLSRLLNEVADISRLAV